MVKKYLAWCWHGFTVVTEPPKYVTAMPSTLCGHAEAMFAKPIKSLEEVIERVEHIKQPRWSKTFHIGKFQFSLVKYWK